MLVDLPSQIAQLSLARALGQASPSAYADVLQSCIRADPGGPALYRLVEEAAATGLRLCDLPSPAQKALVGKVPPEAEAFHRCDESAPAEEMTPAQLFVDPLPPLWVRSTGKVKTFECGGENSDATLAAAWEAVGRRDAPVLFRGVGAHWPALHSWTLPTLRDSLSRGMVRVSPSSQVTFCRESHPDVRAGVVEPPSRTLLMDVGEFTDRLHVGRAGRPPLLYGEGERCYLQALAPHEMMRDLDFSFLTPSAQPPVDQVLGRLWVSAPGTVSPLHFDATDSYLLQVRGTKRLWLWPPDALAALEPYPADHALARRLRVDVTGESPPPSLLSDEETDACCVVRETPVVALLRPGDALYFPKDWAHHTEAADTTGETPSFSLGFRTDGQYLM
jgi:hypothetical protein